MIDIEVDCINRKRSIAILSDGQEVQVTNWLDGNGEFCGEDEAVACVCGPDFDGQWYSVDLSGFTGAVIN